MKPALVLLAAAAAFSPLAACVAPGYGQYGGYGNSGYSPYGNDRYDDRYQGNTFRCESTDHRIRRCPVDTRSGVRLVRQESDAPCVQGRTWGYDRDGVWVSNGCRGRFELGGGGYGYNQPGYGSQYGQGQSQVVRCESRDERRVVCGLPFRARSVQIRRQLSDTRCEQNYNWGWRVDSIWVDRGCRAEFVATY